MTDHVEAYCYQCGQPIFEETEFFTTEDEDTGLLIRAHYSCLDGEY